MNQKEIQLIKTSFAIVKPRAAEAAQQFYARLFELDPALRLFSNQT